MPENSQSTISEDQEGVKNTLDMINAYCNSKDSEDDLELMSKFREILRVLEPKTEYGPRGNAFINMAKGKVNAQDIAYLTAEEKTLLLKSSDINNPATGDLNGGAGIARKTIRRIVSALTNLVYAKADPVESLLKEIKVGNNKYETTKLHELKNNGGHYIYNAAATTNIGITGMKAAIDQSNAIWEQTVTDLRSSAEQSRTEADNHHQNAIGTFLRHAKGYQSNAAEKAADIIIKNSPGQNVTQTLSYMASPKGVSIIGLSPAEKREVEKYQAEKSHKMHVLSLGDSPDVVKKSINKYGNSRDEKGTEITGHITQWLNEIRENKPVKKYQHTGEDEEGELLNKAENEREKYYDYKRMNHIANFLENHVKNSDEQNHRNESLIKIAEVVAANHPHLKKQQETNP